MCNLSAADCAVTSSSRDDTLMRTMASTREHTFLCQGLKEKWRHILHE